MASRAEQREETRDRIVEAATAAFCASGFDGASTRDIAARAGTNQGLITYHFQSKEDLWKAAADRLFGLLRDELSRLLADLETYDPRERAREGIRAYVRFAAAHPELLRFMMEEGTSAGARGQWLVKTHLAPMYEIFRLASSGLMAGADDERRQPHAFYAMAGAASLLFAVPSEARRLTGTDPRRKAVVEAHADYVARLMLP
jgi:TetR/AcrR family transcriptional regulator